MKKNGFTLVEILIVVGLLTILFSMGIGSYTSIQKKARDDRRRADIEQIRAALEIYRTTNNAYPTAAPTPASGLPFGSPLSDLVNTYLQKIPQDPLSPARSYYYATSGGDYTLGAQFEGTSSCTTTPPANSCGTGFSCNYCQGSYGQK
jgi:type II secretion system protein G